MGWISLWAQLILAIISGVMLLCVGGSAAMSKPMPGAGPNPGTGGGILFATISLGFLVYGVFQSWQVVKLGRKLKESNPDIRPKKTATVRLLWTSLMFRGVGLMMSVIAAEAIAGILLEKSLAAVATFFSQAQPVPPLDIFLVLANTHLITAHFIGLAVTLWLLNRIDR